MKTLVAAVVVVTASLSGVWASMMPQMPAGKCRHPIPCIPGLNISQIQNKDFYYAYTPKALIYKMADTVKMNLHKDKDGPEGEYLETIKAFSIFKTPLNMQFKVKDLGNGILKKITKDGEMSYYASIVGIKGNVALVYVCSNESKNPGDFRYVIATKEVDPLTIEHPDIMFKDVNDKHNFVGEMRELPQKWKNKVNL